MECAWLGAYRELANFHSSVANRVVRVIPNAANFTIRYINEVLPITLSMEAQQIVL